MPSATSGALEFSVWRRQGVVGASGQGIWVGCHSLSLQLNSTHLLVPSGLEGRKEGTAEQDSKLHLAEI